MAVTFAGIATLAAVGGAWAVRVNQYGRLLALVLLTAFAATLLSRRLADQLARPFVALGNRLLPQSRGRRRRGGPDLLAAARRGDGAPMGTLRWSDSRIGPDRRRDFGAQYAYHAAAVFLRGGRGHLAGCSHSRRWARVCRLEEIARRGRVGSTRARRRCVIRVSAAIALGFDSTVLTRLSLAGTNRWEQSLIDKIKPDATPQSGSTMAMSNTSMTGGNAMMMAAKRAGALPVEGEIPSFSGATAWLNSPALTSEALRGKVVLVDFWTYSCINCLRALPYVKEWYEKYKDHGLVVVGVHAPEFAFEKNLDNVRRAVSDLGIAYPVALDNNYAIWQGFNNQYWPAHYFIDATGQIRAHHFGEGNYEESERIIRQLLTQAGYTNLPLGRNRISQSPSGVEAAADEAP